MQLTLSYANHNRITQTYATAIAHQSQADLTRVATDLTQITPPRNTKPHTTTSTPSPPTPPTNWLPSPTTGTRQPETQELHALDAESKTINHLSQTLLG